MKLGEEMSNANPELSFGLTTPEVDSVRTSDGPVVVLSFFAAPTVRLAIRRWEGVWGSQSFVLFHPEKKSVIKLTTNKALAQLLKKQQKARLPGLPRVMASYGKVGYATLHGAEKAMFGFKLEVLQANSAKAGPWATQVQHIREQVMSEMSGPLVPLDISIVQIDRFSRIVPSDLRSAVALIREVAVDTGGRFDLQDVNNWMCRTDGTVIMSSPLVLL